MAHQKNHLIGIKLPKYQPIFSNKKNMVTCNRRYTGKHCYKYLGNNTTAEYLQNYIAIS